MKLLCYVIITLLLMPAFASEKLQEAINKYQDAPAVKADVKKTSVYALLEETKISEGEMIFSKGLMRMNLKSKNDPTLIVVNEDAIWVETDSGFGDGKHVMKIQSKAMKDRSRAPIALILENKDILKVFKIEKENKEKSSTEFVLVPKKEDEVTELVEMTLKVNKNNELIELSYKDDIDNMVTYSFSKADFKYKAKEGDFKYEKPSGSKIVVY